MKSVTADLVSEAQRKQFQTEGYFVLPGVVPPAQLAMLREVCSQFIAAYDAEMDAAIVKMATDADPAVRMIWGMRQLMILRGTPAGWEAGLKDLERQFSGDADAGVRDLMTLLIADERARGAAKPPAPAKPPEGAR